MAFSRFGRKLAAAHLAIMFFAVLVLAFSVRVNVFTDWFYHADLFPFGLSIATLLIIGVLLTLDCVVDNPITGRAQFEFVVLGFLSLFWLAFNGFTTSRYREVPYRCFSVIPEENPGLRTWCVNVQATKAFMWIEWVLVTVTLASVARYAQSEYSKGNRHVMKVALTRYEPDSGNQNPSTAYPFAPGVAGHGISNPRPVTGMSDSEFMQYEKALGHNEGFYKTQRYEAPSRLMTRSIASEEPIPDEDPYAAGGTMAATTPTTLNPNSAGVGAMGQSYDSNQFRLNSYYADASGYTPHYQQTTQQQYQPQYQQQQAVVASGYQPHQ